MLEQNEIEEFEMFSTFLRERLPAIPSEGKDLVEFLRTFKSELEGLDVATRSVAVLVDGYIALATAELKAIARKERLWAACFFVVVVTLIALALGIHPDHSLAEALGR